MGWCTILGLCIFCFFVWTAPRRNKRGVYYSLKNAYRILVRKPEGKRPLRRPRRRRVDNIKMDLGGEIGWDGRGLD
jgi:hypothetical protein